MIPAGLQQTDRTHGEGTPVAGSLPVCPSLASGSGFGRTGLSWTSAKAGGYKKGVKSILWYVLAAFAEIGGCFAFWAWQRSGKHWAWIFPGLGSLTVFALALTRVDAENAGRTYAAYGGIYILSSLVWLWVVEKTRPDRWDALGVTLCLFGAALILWGPRGK